MMDIYAHSGDYDKAEKIFNQFTFDFTNVNVMIDSFGKGAMTTLVSAMFNSTVRDENVSRESLNTLIDAWAESSRPNASACVTQILKLWEENERLRKLRIRPDTSTYNLVLRGLSRANKRRGFQSATETLEEMETRYSQGDTLVKPNSGFILLYDQSMPSSSESPKSRRHTAAYGRYRHAYRFENPLPRYA